MGVEHYTLGRGSLKIGPWVGATPPAAIDLVDVGNVDSFEFELSEELLEHFSKKSGTKVKDKTAVLETGYGVNFVLDEITVANLAMFLKGTIETNVIHANQAIDKEYALEFTTDNPEGDNYKYEFWKLKLSPNGSFSLIGDEWSALSFSGAGLADQVNHAASPHFDATKIVV